MPLTLYSIPFTFTLTGIRLIAAATPHEAADIAAKTMSFEETNLYESAVFWGEGARIDKIQCTPAFGPATPYEGSPEDQGFFSEDLEMEEETEARLAKSTHEEGR